MTRSEKVLQLKQDFDDVYETGYEKGKSEGGTDNAAVSALIDGSIKELVIPDGTTLIKGYAFSRCYDLASIEIPDSVLSIGDHAFYCCTGLKSIEIPGSVINIYDSAFSRCSGLTNVAIPDSVTSIGSYGFYECSRLESIVIPEIVTGISDYAFYGCASLNSIKIPDSVTSICSYAFSNCTSLSSIIVGRGLEQIRNYAFSGCKNVSVYDFSKCTTVPVLSSTSSIAVNGNTKIFVPSNLYDEWVAATNWATYSKYIYRATSKAAPNQDNFNIYVDAHTLKEIVDYDVLGVQLAKGIDRSEILYEGKVPYLRMFGDGKSAEAYAFIQNIEGRTTGGYLVFAYRIPTGNSKTINYFEVYANTTGELPTGKGDFFSIKAVQDGGWNVVAIDLKEAIANHKDVVDGTYQSQFTGEDIQHLRIDFFNAVTPTTDFIDIAYIGTCTSLELARSADADYESATFDAVRLASALYSKALRKSYNGMDYVTITDTTTSGGEANTALVLSDAVLPNTANYIGVLYRNAPGGFVEFFASSDNSKWATSARSNYDTSDGWHFAIVSLNSSIFKDSVCRRLRFDYLNNLKADTKYSIDIAFAKFFSSVDEANAYYQEYATKYNV